MSTLNEYLSQKRKAVLARKAKVEAGEAEIHQLEAHVKAEGRSGIRHIQIRQHHVISDSKYDFAGCDLGPGSPELQLGVLGSCLTHIFLIHAADQRIPLDELSVDVSGQLDPNAGRPGYENVPVYPHNIRYTVHVKSPATARKLDELLKTVERSCPLLNLLIHPQDIKGTLVHVDSTDVKAKLTGTHAGNGKHTQTNSKAKTKAKRITVA